MSRKRKTLIWILVGVLGGGITSRLIYKYRLHKRPVVLTGAVIRKDPDPRKQSPIADAKISVVDGAPDETTTSDASGLFRLTVHPLILELNRSVDLEFEHAEYQPLNITVDAKDQLYVVRMEPLPARQAVTEPDHQKTPAKPVQIANVRLRYSVKNQTLINVGSVAKQFEVVNTGGVPCKGKRPCSPDGKWKAASSTLSLDAQKGDEFRNVRVSCIAGPCPFTRLEPSDLSRPSRKIEITGTTWSDTASFLVEAEVTRTMTTDMLRQSFPFVNGQAMSFALPPSADGPSIIADVNGEEIVFPIGPNLTLSWTTCSVEVAQGGNRVYRCEVKPGYQIQQ